MTRRFTGKHMTAIVVAFFGTIIAVNATMAVFATRTFGGKVVENSYVASQRFNGWLEAARAQERLGWTSAAALDETRHVVVRLDSGEAPLADAMVTAVARHPLGRQAEVPLRFAADGQGAYRSDRALPAGRWQVHFHFARGGDQARVIETLS